MVPASSSPPSAEEYLQLLYTLAEQGNGKAQYNLGAMLLHGQGVARNDGEALQWMRRAAEQNILPAQHNLAVMLLQGQGVERNPLEAVKWFRQAAEQGDPRSQHALGALLFEGLGVATDLPQAYFWLSLSAVAAPTDLQEQASEICRYLADLLTGEQRQAVQQQVDLWLRKRRATV
ncbi:tetratricopeptide repeat protein [Candidatus Magnetaquicoccus inordinatus]|uniref:tetratricopeptide repeat protein n=1 Tax=Candidatus Magnetaquicoccus inordinatus TaxID=2496818 RepID=UPI00102C8A85|nr:tetratricopeptide repeat protein [Candidatus Magnetaquicoccus inordinatus]